VNKDNLEREREEQSRRDVEGCTGLLQIRDHLLSDFDHIDS
jgi:hypothetical protein